MRHLISAPLPEMLLRVGVAFSFLYPPINALVDPYAWSGYFPSFLLSIVGAQELLVLHLFGIVEVVLALWILFGKNIRVPSAIAAFLLLLIVVTNLNQFQVLFRDISIALMAGALALMHRKPIHA